MILYLITGQYREGKIAAESHIQAIKQLHDKFGQESVHVLFVLWDLSFHIFPKSYRSFIEVTQEDIVNETYAELKNHLTVKLVSESDGINFLSSMSAPTGIDDFGLRTYLNLVSLREVLQIEKVLGRKFELIIKTRPDVLIQNFVPPNYLEPHASIVMGDITRTFIGPKNEVVCPQANDVYEIMNRIGFLLYSQMIWSLNEKYRCPLFWHTWVAEFFARQCMLSIDKEKGQGGLIVRPLYRLLDNKIDVSSLRDHNHIWQSDVNSSGEKWLALMDEQGIKYEVR